MAPASSLMALRLTACYILRRQFVPDFDLAREFIARIRAEEKIGDRQKDS